MVLYNLAIFFGINNKTYLVFSGYVCSMALFLSSGDGTGARFLWPNAPYIQEVAIGLTWTTTVVLMVEFAQHFLRMKHRRRVTHTARWVQIVAGIVGLLVVVSPTPTIYGLQTGYSVLIFMFTLSLAVQRALRAG